MVEDEDSDNNGAYDIDDGGDARNDGDDNDGV